MREQSNYKKFIPENEEIRSGFKVTSNRKKVWNIQLWLLEELKRICEKYNIKYYADWWTLIWAVRHNWYIPRDDDIDIVMFREDYEKFLTVLSKELPSHIELWDYYGQFSKLINKRTAALYDDYIWGIRIDIFPIDYASKFLIVNRIKVKILNFLVLILYVKKAPRFTGKAKKWKKIFAHLLKYIFKKIDYAKIYQMREKISKTTLFKWKNIYTAAIPYRFYPEDIYDKSHDCKFENSTICIPDGYDVYLKIAYWDYMTPVIFQWWHNCRYSVDKPYKDIIKLFDKSKSNEDNYKDCKCLFLL